MIVLFLGAPGTGKGTLANILQTNHNYIHISTGDIFRENIKNKTELGIKVQQIIDGGNLVDDETTFMILKDKLNSINLNESKIILDGYPRTIDQAEMLEAYLKNEKDTSIKTVIDFIVPEEVIIERLSSRVLDTSTGKTYNKNNLPLEVNEDNLTQREDDKPENIKVRLKAYDKQTLPLSQYYKDKDLLKNLNANQLVEEILKDLLDALN